MHIIRNSIDHGIETPDVREKLGKNRIGNIAIQAIQKESKIVINIKRRWQRYRCREDKTKGL